MSLPLLRLPLTRLAAPRSTTASTTQARLLLQNRAIRPSRAARFYSAERMDYSAVQTPGWCYADFCLIPVGTANVSVAEEVAEVQRLLRSSGLTCTMHSAGTTVEGSWNDVFKVIGQAHTLVHQKGVLRVQSSMRVGTRTDKKQAAKDKVQRVEDILAKSE